MDEVPAGIWQRVRFERERLGHETVRAFAKVVEGVSWQRLAALERDVKRHIKFDELAALAEAGCDVQFILTGKRKLREDESKLIDNYRASNASGQQALRRVGVAFAESLSKSETGTDA